MTWFESRNVSEADVPFPRRAIWDAVSSPDTLAALTPLVRRIDATGDQWRWRLARIDALGLRVEPSFTEKMSFVPEERIEFTHLRTSERAGAEGVYRLDERSDGGTHLCVDITIGVDLPLPALARKAVTKVMASMMTRTGDAFAANLRAHLASQVRSPR